MNFFIIYFCLSVITFLFSILFSYKNRDKKSNSLTVLFVGVLIATGFLVFATYSKLDIATQLMYTLFYVFDTPTMSVDFDILNNVPSELFRCYKYLLYLYCILAPLLTVGVIISFLENKIYELRSKLRTKKSVHIFSEINEKSVTLAETIKNKDNIVIICDSNDNKEFNDRLRKRKCIILRQQISDIDFSNYLGEIIVYEISENQDKNLDKTLGLIELHKNTNRNITIYIFSINIETQVILDSVDKGNLKTIIVNEIQQMVYRVLDEVPLYKNVSNNIISVLIIGAGKIGTEFLKAISWCGQMIDYKLEINIIDKNASKIEKEILFKCPQLKSPNYDINYYEVDINTTDALEVIEKYCNNTNYIIINMGNDNANLNCAVDMRRIFSRKNKKPFINLSIENTDMKKQIERLKNENGNSYNLYVFGGIEELYGRKNILNEKIEILAQKIHLNYNPKDIDLIEYYKIEYYKSSSRASALHIKYKLYSILKDETPDKKTVQKMLKNNEIRDLLAKNEHDRWCAYIRSTGYDLAPIEKVKEYKDITNHHVHHLAKLHPALVEYEKLDDVSKELSKIMGKNIDLKKSDFSIIDILLNINY